MKSNYKYIHFEEMESKPKTRVWKIVNNTHGDTLGYVKWYPAWRQYCSFITIPFIPTSGEIVFSFGCHDDISDFLKQANSEQKKVKIVEVREG